MSAGIQISPPTTPAVNIEQLVRNKVMVVKLSTGEYLVGAVLQVTDIGLNIANPYEIVSRSMQLRDQWIEVPVLEKHCPFVKNRIFFIGWSNVVYSKEINENFGNIYLEQFIKNEPNDYAQLLAAHQTQKEQKLTVMVNDSMVRVDADKIFVMGNETRH